MKQSEINKKLRKILNNQNPYLSTKRINFYPIKYQNNGFRKRNKTR
jgi:hypothetical protein